MESKQPVPFRLTIMIENALGRCGVFGPFSKSFCFSQDINKSIHYLTLSDNQNNLGAHYLLGEIYFEITLPNLIPHESTKELFNSIKSLSTSTSFEKNIKSQISSKKADSQFFNGQENDYSSTKIQMISYPEETPIPILTSSYFTKTKGFTETTDFTKSTAFTESAAFTKSDNFEPTIDFAHTQE